jgi:toxin ParE1/3/4
MSYELTQRALYNLAEANEEIPAGSRRVARQFLIRVIEVFELLCSNPELGQCRPELKTGLRSFPLLACVIYYRVAGGRVQILCVGHGVRDERALSALLEQ